eukprot:9115826-Pyramimonas_sp.AAC.1
MKPRAVSNRLTPPRATTPCVLTPCDTTPSGMRSNTTVRETEEAPFAGQGESMLPCSTYRLAWLGQALPPGGCCEGACDSMSSFAVRLST